MFAIFLEFRSTKQGLPLADSWSRGLDLTQMYPDRDRSSNVPRFPRSGYITARDQSMVERSLTNSRGSRVQSRGRGSNVAAGENDLEFEVTE